MSPSKPPWIVIPFHAPVNPLRERWDLSTDSPKWNPVVGSSRLATVTVRAARDRCEKSVVTTASVEIE